MIKSLIDRKLEKLKEIETCIGIVLVGSFKDIYMSESYKKTRDIDIFIILENGKFQREVYKELDIEWDISYISIENLKKGIDMELNSLISVIGKGKVIYSSNSYDSFHKEIKSIFKKGPNRKTDIYCNYQRFKLTKFLEEIKEKRNSLELDMMMGEFLKDILIFYYELNRIWKPPTKKLINSIEDEKLNRTLEDYLNKSDIDGKMIGMYILLDYILAPIGGQLKEWEKGEYPFDFN